MAVSEQPWGDTSAASFDSAEAYCNACLVNENTGPASSWAKGACKLPVYEPGGDLSRRAAHGAAAVLAGARGGVQATPASKRSAARKLVQLYTTQLKETPPPSLTRLARG